MWNYKFPYVSHFIWPSAMWLYLSQHPVRFAFCMNTLYGRRIPGPEKEHSMSEETSAIIGIAALAIDCTDPPGLAHWWSRLLGGTVEVHPPGDVTLRTPAGLALDFAPVPEPKTGKNRLHLNVRSHDFATAVADALTARHRDCMRPGSEAAGVRREDEGEGTVRARACGPDTPHARDTMGGAARGAAA
jgi:Glyoxalase-like domain